MPVNHIVRKYHISKASLMRWMKRLNGPKDSFLNRSHRPLSPHPNSHTSVEIDKVANLLRRNPDIGLNELYSKLRTSIGYARHYASLYRLLRRIGFYDIIQEKHKPYVPKPYQTPMNLGEKWQMDGKFIPKACKANLIDENRYYNYVKFYSYPDLIKQMKAYFYRSNRICMSTLKWLTPIDKRQQLISLNLVASIA